MVWFLIINGSNAKRNISCYSNYSSGLNAALMAMQIMSIKYPKLKEDLKTYRQEMASKGIR